MESIQKSNNKLQEMVGRPPHKLIQSKLTLPTEKIELVKNQIIKGLVTDVRPNEVTLKLANQQTVQGKLEGNPELNIGEIASFKIMDCEKEEVTLLRLNPKVSYEDQTIYKALEEANLPVNETTYTIVKELLANQLPIHKESILQFLRQATQYKDAQISTLIFINKEGLPLTEETVAMLEQYRNHEHRLMSQLSTIGEEMINFLQTASKESTDSTLFSFTNHLLTWLENPETTSSIKEQPTSGLTVTQLPQDLYYISVDLSPDAQTDLIGLFAPYGIDEELMNSIADNTISYGDLMNTLFSTMLNNEEGMTPLAEFAKQEVVQQLLRKLDDATLLASKQNIAQDNNQQGFSTQTLAAFYPAKERLELATMLEPLSLSSEEMANVLTGNFSSKQLLQLLKMSQISNHSSTLRSIFSTKSFGRLLESSLLSKILLSPEQLKEENGVTNYYNQLPEKLQQLTNLTSLLGKEDLASQLSTGTGQIQENLEFMSQLNQLYPYVQLPLQLKGQATHGELYVYTKKKKALQNSNELSILLHLDMEQLGPIDVHIGMYYRQITTKFYLNDKDTIELIQSQMSTLEDKLLEHGYSFKSEVLTRQEKIDFVNECLTNARKGPEMKRYSFDIRA